jgi:hypothetical protein
MYQIWIVLGAVIAIAAVMAPLAAIVLVSVASRREESVKSLTGQAPGAITGAARRLLAFRGDSIAPAPRRSAGSPGRRAPGHDGTSRSPVRPARSPQPVWLIADAHPAGQAPGTLGEPDLEVRFGHARRSVPAARQYPARRQPQSSPVRVDQRQGAGV